MQRENIVNSPWSLTKAFEDLSVCFLLAAFPLASCFSLTVFGFLDAGCFGLEMEAEALSCSATVFFDVFFRVFSMLLASFTEVFLTDEVLSTVLPTELSLTALLEARLRDFGFSSSSSDLLSSSLSLFGAGTSSSSWESSFASEISALSSSSSSEDSFCFFPDWEVCFCF